MNVALNFNLFAGRVCWCAANGELGCLYFISRASNEKESHISSSGLVQLPPRDMNDSMLPRDEMDESEKPDDEVGLLDVSLRLDSRSSQCCGPAKTSMVLTW